jgi:predicted amidohydrolase YtcJ
MSLPCIADLLLYGGRVLTLDPARPHAQAVAVAAGRILAVGTDDDLRSFVSPRTQTLNCQGRTILPGFIDPHLHLFAWASRFCGVDVSTARSIPELQTLLSDRLSSLPHGQWLRGYGYDEFFLAEKRHPTKHDLDLITSERPIILRHRTGHAAVLNSVALQLAGIHPSFTPLHGGQIERDSHTGEPTGVTYELESYLRTVVPPLTPQDFSAGVQQAGKELLRLGVTSFHDASVGNTVEDLALFRRLRTDNLLRSRATVMLGHKALPRIVEAGLTPFFGDQCVRSGSLKIMVHESRGDLYPPPDELAELVWQIHRHGFQVAIHAVEEGPVCAALDAIERALTRFPRVEHRHRLEHCALCPPPFIDKLAETGTVVVTQPGFLYFYGEKYAAEVDPNLHDWLYRSKSFLERGVPVAGSSDCPIAPLAPLLSLQAAMTRRSRSGLFLNPQDRLSLPEALALFTSAGAWVGFEENQKGRIMPGVLADLIVLDRDLLTVPTEEVGNCHVAMTIVGGEVVWENKT